MREGATTKRSSLTHQTIFSMKATLLGIAVFFGLAAMPVQGQARLDGRVYASLYAWENAAENQQWDTYQGLQLRLRPSEALTFKTTLRLARRGDPAAWDERIYNAYLDWRPAGTNLEVRFGRQFLYTGVINGSYDGLVVRAQPRKRWDLRLVGGFAVPFDRALRVRSWGAGGTLGGYAAYRFGPLARLDVSYLQRLRGERIAWRQAGAALTGAWRAAVFYQAQIAYNLEQATYQGMRYRLTYRLRRWAVSGEFNSQKPRIFEDSFFNIFELIEFNQIRGGVTYQIGAYQVGAQYLHTIYEREETNDEVILSVGTRWGTLGAVYQTGYGGEQVGLFGDVRYDLTPGLALRLHASHYDYERRSIAFHEDATAFSGGLRYRPRPFLSIQAELQESLNSFYDNDLRALVRVNYSFRGKIR